MKKFLLFLSITLLALVSMPVDVFAGMANNLLQPDSPEILEEAERIKKEANRFIWGTHDDATIFVLHPLSVDTNKIRNHVAISDAVKYWKEQCKSAVLVSSSAAKSYTTREKEKGSNTIFSCVIADCKDPSKYKVAKDGSMCEMTKEYERQLDKERKEAKKSERDKKKVLQNHKQDRTKAQQEICNDTDGAKWKSGKCVCTDSRFTWDPEELECVIESDKPYKKACEEQAGGRWITRGNTSTCVCPKPEELWNRSTKKCSIEDDEAEEEIKATPSAYESQKPFLEEGIIKQQFIIYKLFKEGGTAQRENEAEFAEWKKTCADVGKQNHVKAIKIVTDVNPETNVYRWHNCVADTCEEGYENPSQEWPVCQKDEDVKPGKKCTVAYGKGVGTYDENKKCKLTDCEGKNYTLNEDKNKCELNTTANIRNNKIEKAFIADVNKLISAFDAVFDKYLSECETSGKEIKDGQCVEKSNEEQS